MNYGVIPKPSVELHTVNPVDCEFTEASAEPFSFPNASEYLSSFIKDSTHTAVFKQNTKLSGEEYKLTFYCGTIYIEASADAGAFYAAVTLKNILSLGELQENTVIHDKPRYLHRGLMLDECRHFFGKEEMLKILNIMSLLKMNRLHWHLSDDQGFRIESKRFPRLNDVGSWRSHKYLGDFMVKTKGERYGGFYTADEIKEIVSFAAKRNIEIIPEIDLPGHSRAILSAYPLAGCRDYKTTVWSKAGISDQIICCGKNDGMSFVFELLDEVSALFPFHMFHIGGDEAIHRYWKKCPHCQNRIRDNGLKSEKELQGWFSAQIADHLAKKGKTAVIWNDGLTENMNDEIICQFWDTRKSDQTKKLLGNKRMIYSPTMPFYLDNRYSAISSEKILSFNECDYDLGAAPENVLGIEACVWSEWLNDEDMLEYALFPRLAAVAEVAWVSSGTVNATEFANRLSGCRDTLFKDTCYSVLDYAGASKGFEKRRDIKHFFGARGFEFKENLVLKGIK